MSRWWPAWVLAVGVGVARPALADDAPSAPPLATAPANPATALLAAKEAYVQGDFERARAAFLALVQRARNVGDVPDEVVIDAWLHLGELQLFEGDRRAAEASFRMALLVDPDLRVSPVEHPESVIGVVEVVRQTVRAEGPEKGRIKPLPWWGYTPFGAPQFVQRRPVRGALYAALQAGAAASSIAAWVEIDRRRAAVPDEIPEGRLEDAQAEIERIRLLRDAWSVPSAAAFYVVWAISATDAGLAWRGAKGAPRAVAVLPQADGVQVAASWRF